jgi:hypothetical protein
MPQLTQALLLALLAFFGLYLVYEIVRWTRANQGGLTPGQFRRRICGGVLLELDILMWLLYGPLMSGRPAREQLVYLLGGVLLVVVPMLLAVREAAFVTRQFVKWRGEMVRGFVPPERDPAGGPDATDA